MYRGLALASFARSAGLTPKRVSRLEFSAARTFALAALLSPAVLCAQEALPALPNKAIKATPVERQASDASDELQSLTSTPVYRADPYLVRGRQVFTGKLLATQALIFEANSTLVLTPKDQSETVTIVADVIDIKGSGGRITWSLPYAPTEIPPGRGEAPSGLLGRGSGEAGGKGLDGDQGNVGLSGKPALNLIIAFKEWNNKDLSIDLRGSQGGPGGAGQDGGAGGQGGQGSPARPGIFDCASGPGQGGRGGDGGAAGRGGAGGVGGAGGTVMLISSATKDALGDVRVFVAGGEGGIGGPPGKPGVPGPGGREGETSGLCRPAGRGGPPGNAGVTAVRGTGGQLGASGQFIVIPVSQATSDRVFRTQ